MVKKIALYQSNELDGVYCHESCNRTFHAISFTSFRNESDSYSFDMISVLFGILLFLVFLSFIFKALQVREKNGAKRAAITSGVVILPFFICPFLPISVELIFLGLTAAIMLLILILLFLPIGRVSVKNEVPAERFDERDIPF